MKVLEKIMKFCLGIREMEFLDEAFVATLLLEISFVYDDKFIKMYSQNNITVLIIGYDGISAKAFTTKTQFSKKCNFDLNGIHLLLLSLSTILFY